MTIRIAAVLLSSILGLAPAAHAQLAGSPAPQPAARHFLWEVSSLTNKVYLFGTIHAGKKSFYPLPVAVREAFDEAKVIAVEADITDAATMAKGGASMTLQPPDTLSKHVPGPLYERFLRQLARPPAWRRRTSRSSSPSSRPRCFPSREWGRQGYSQQYGVDLQLILRAQEREEAPRRTRGRRRRRRPSWAPSRRRSSCRPSRARWWRWKAAPRATRSRAW